MPPVHDTVVDPPFPPTVIDRALLSGFSRRRRRTATYAPVSATQRRLLLAAAGLLGAVALYAFTVLGADHAVGAVTDKSVVLVKTVAAETRLIAEPVHARGVLTVRSEPFPRGKRRQMPVPSRPVWVIRTVIAEEDAVRVQVGDMVRAELGGFGDRVFEAHVTLIAGKPAASGDFAVEMEVKPGDADLISGVVALVELEPLALDPLVAIPIEALLQGNGRRGHVFVLGDDGVHVRRVTVDIAFVDGQSVVVSSGLASGSQVVTDGASSLKDGAAVSRYLAEPPQSGKTHPVGASLPQTPTDVAQSPTDG